METAQIARCLLEFFLFFISLTLHHWGHAWMADKLGDPNPRREGRVSINPIVHIDLFGTIIFPLLCNFLTLGIIFGWGKPISINSSYFKHKKWGEFLVNIAGPICNLLLCFIASLVLAFLPSYRMIAYALLEINALFIAFNCLPLPGLDSFMLLRYGLRLSDETVEFMERWSFFILIILINIPLVRTLLLVFMNFIVVSFLQLSYLFMQLM